MNTPTIKSITLSDGTRLEDRGEVRAPKEGEWFVTVNNDVALATPNFGASGDRLIFSPVEAPAGGVERWECYVATTLIGTEVHGINPLIDAACAVVNSMAYTDPVAGSALAKLAAALEPFTQAVKEERFYVERRGEMFYVMDHDDDTASWLGDFVGKFNTEQDAKDFAAMKNSQSEGGE